MRKTGDFFSARLAGWALLAALSLSAGVAQAIDNPDRPDPVMEFASRARDFETRIAEAGMERDALAVWLIDQGFTVAASDANFLLFGLFADRDAVWRALLEEGVLIR